MKKALSLFFIFLFIITFIILMLTGFYSASLPKRLLYDSPDDIKLSPVLSLKDSTASPVSENAPEVKKLMLFNTIPVGEIKLEKTSRTFVIPGGEPIGIKLLSKGVLVIKLGDVNGECPAKDAGICPGDIIVSVNGKEVMTNEEIEKAIQKSDKPEAEIKLIRNSEEKTVYLTPAFSEQDGCKKAGLWVRDSSAGIGTLSFYCPDTQLFAGLGHPICDADTGEMFDISKGSVCGAGITGFKKAEGDKAGELEGQFNEKNLNGDILINCDCGIYGTLDKPQIDRDAVPLAFKQEVEIGDAEILTTIDGSEPQRYSCKIEQINNEGTKNLVIRITDEDLLKATGGILQGMSGSPIIQNGRLVGAVTHVMLETSEMGYGIFAETMLEKLNSVSGQSSDSLKIAS